MAMPPGLTIYVLLPPFQVFLEHVGVAVLPGVAGPEVENAALGVAAVSVVFAALVFVADAAGPLASDYIAPAFDF